MALIAFTDTESTGLLNEKHKLIELSIRVCDLDTQKQVEEYLWRFNPKRNIDAKAFAVHGIDIKDLKDEPLIEEKMPEIKAIFERMDLVVAHNGDWFDFPFIQMEAASSGVEPIEWKTFDSMVHGTFATELGKSPSLKELCWAAGVVYDPALAHAGDYDTLVMRDAFFVHLNNGWFKIEKS